MALKRRREDTRREFRRDTDTAVWGDAFDAVMLLTHELLVSLMPTSLLPYANVTTVTRTCLQSIKKT